MKAGPHAAAHRASAVRALEAVHFYELCLAAHWYRAALEEPAGREPPAEALARLRRILDRARSAARRAPA